MMTCKCKCATCVRNAKIYVNTPDPCFFCDCDICGDQDMALDYCSRHLTLAQVNAMAELVKQGLTMEEARAIIGI